MPPYVPGPAMQAYFEGVCRASALWFSVFMVFSVTVFESAHTFFGALCTLGFIFYTSCSRETYETLGTSRSHVHYRIVGSNAWSTWETSEAITESVAYDYFLSLVVVTATGSFVAVLAHAWYLVSRM